MTRKNQLRRAYQSYMSARKARYDEVIRNRDDISKDASTHDFTVHKSIMDEIDIEEKQPIDTSKDHNIGVPTRRK